jgi:hypothetical protein
VLLLEIEMFPEPAALFNQPIPGCSCAAVGETKKF